MSDTQARVALRARLVFPISSPPLDGGVITIQGGQIAALGQNLSAQPARDLGDVAILPGLINPHTHLEFSELSSPVGQPGISMPDWISQVVQRRREAADQPEKVLSTARRSVAIQHGMRACLRNGTTTIGDIATWDVTQDVLRSEPLRCVLFRELIGLTDEQIAERLDGVRRYLAADKGPTADNKRALSPHAPYTAAADLVRQVVQLSRQHELNVAMHVAESSEELQLLARGDGPLRDLLQRFDVWNETAFPGGKRPRDYLQMLSTAHRSLIIHGNYLGAEDWALLARHRANMSLVYCPRTHDYFPHPPYPLGKILRAGVRVVLGTDSLASNPDLDVLNELRFAVRRHRDIDPGDLLRMVTLDAAQSLGCADRVGSLQRGKQADLAIVQLGGTSTMDRDPYDALLDDASQICATWMGGVRYDRTQ